MISIRDAMLKPLILSAKLILILLLTSCTNKTAEIPNSSVDTPSIQVGSDTTSATTEAIATTTPETTKPFSNRKESTTTDEPEVTEYVPDELNVSIIYGSGNAYNEDNVPSAGKAYISNELESVLKEYGSSSSVRYAIYIDVYTADDNDTIDLFLKEYTVNGQNYEDICNQRDIIVDGIYRLREVSDNVIHTELTAAEIDEYQRQINDLEKQDAELYEISMDMLYEAEQYMLKTESDRLAEMGLTVYGITHNKRSSNYILAIVSAEEIKTMPGDRGVGYKIGLTAE